MAWKVGAVVAALLCLSWAGWFFISGAEPDKPHAEKPPLGEFIFFDGKHGYINGKGEIVIPPRFDYADDFANNGLAYVKENGKWGWIDKTGTFIIPPRFDNAWPFADNGLAPVKENGKYGYIDKTITFIIPPRIRRGNPHPPFHPWNASREESGRGLLRAYGPRNDGGFGGFSLR
ncbi:MAG: WG repeat-containing protein [Zoogloeaceae bacterium]|nr:WG repeat-containing protein [Zoogloeaceae bacterium]